MKNFKYHITLILLALACGYSGTTKASSRPMVSEEGKETFAKISDLVGQISLNDAKAIFLTEIEKNFSELPLISFSPEIISDPYNAFTKIISKLCSGAISQIKYPSSVGNLVSLLVLARYGYLEKLDNARVEAFLQLTTDETIKKEQEKITRGSKITPEFFALIQKIYAAYLMKKFHEVLYQQ